MVHIPVTWLTRSLGIRLVVDVDKGEIGEEEIHGGVQMWVRADDQDDECIPSHSDQVHTQEEPEEDVPLPWVTGDAKQEELADSSLILFPQDIPLWIMRRLESV
jgi:hypothetical protein